MARNINRLRRLEPKTTAFFLCDIQEKFRKAMPLFDALVKNTSKMLEASKILEIPLLVSEQYPEKLGNTAKELDICHACEVIPKTHFSMLVPQMDKNLKEIFGGKPRDVVLFGIEAHVCVEQTSMDLINQDVNVFLVTDCCCSRLNQDRDMAFQRLKQFSCILTTSESVIFNLMKDKNHPKFNTLRDIVKTTSADMQMSKTNTKS